MTWQEIYDEAEAYREDAVNDKEVTNEEIALFMSEIKKAIKDNKLIK